MYYLFVIVLLLLYIPWVSSQTYHLCDVANVLCVRVNGLYGCDNCNATSVTNVLTSVPDGIGNYTIYLVGDPSGSETELAESTTIVSTGTPEDIELINVIRPYPGHNIKWVYGGTALTIVAYWWEITGEGGALTFENTNSVNAPIILVTGPGAILTEITIINKKYVPCTDMIKLGPPDGTALGFLLERVEFSPSSGPGCGSALYIAFACNGLCPISSFTQKYGSQRRVWVKDSVINFRGNYGIHTHDNLYLEGSYLYMKVTPIRAWRSGMEGIVVVNNVFYCYDSSHHEIIEDYYLGMSEVSAFGENLFYNNLIVDAYPDGAVDSIIVFFAKTNNEKVPYPWYIYNNIVSSDKCVPTTRCGEACQAQAFFKNNHHTNRSCGESSWEDVGICGVSTVLMNQGNNSAGTVVFNLTGDVPYPYYDLAEELWGLPFPTIPPYVLPTEDMVGRPRPGPGASWNRTSLGPFQYKCPSQCLVGGKRIDCQRTSDCGCLDGYIGLNCQLERLSQEDCDAQVCGDRGDCFFNDRIDWYSCNCHVDYYGEKCNITTCGDVLSNDTSNVCSGRGNCLEFDRCECHERYHGGECKIADCFGYLANETETVCSSHGKCVDVDSCKCNSTLNGFFQPKYPGLDCGGWYCFGIQNNETETVCGGHGICTDMNFCNCTNNFTHPVSGKEDCSSWQCYGKDQKVPSLTDPACTGRGNCTFPDTCDCFENYTSVSDCSVWTCFSVENIDLVNVCGGHGSCVAYDVCQCESKSYTGVNCDIYTCSNISRYDISRACSGHGLCVSLDNCQCFEGYYDASSTKMCSEYNCYGIHKDVASSVCSGHGNCLTADGCQCKGDFDGDDCETWSCGVDHKLASTCNGHGKCMNPNECKCNTGFGGSMCENNLMYATVMAPILSVAGVGFVFLMGCVIYCICVICCASVFALIVFLGCAFGLVFKQTKGLKRFSRLQNFDLLLKEQELDEDTTVAHLRINKSLFEIPFDEIKTISILGEGGSNSVVFKADWKNTVVAFKCFKTRQVMSSQDKFDEFEREVEILGSLSHPNIIQFYGASMQKPRVGIVMEYACNGELLEYIQKFRRESGSAYPLFQKLRMLYQVSAAMLFLHSRSIIHRDLKSENVLIDEKENTKLMDFGLSRLVDTMSIAKTLRVGTSVYMAPEIVTNERYTEKCDVFSFAILFYITMTEEPNPYGGIDTQQVEIRVANDPSFRPSIKNLSFLEEEDGDQYGWITEIIKKSWDHAPENRYSFKELCDIIDKGYKRITDGNKDVTVASSSKPIISNDKFREEDDITSQQQDLDDDDSLSKEDEELFKSMSRNDLIRLVLKMRKEENLEE